MDEKNDLFVADDFAMLADAIAAERPARPREDMAKRFWRKDSGAIKLVTSLNQAACPHENHRA